MMSSKRRDTEGTIMEPVKAKKTGFLRLAWAWVRGVFGRLRRAQGRRAMATGSPLLGMQLAGVPVEWMITAIRAAPTLDRRMDVYAEMVREWVAPGGRLRH